MLTMNSRLLLVVLPLIVSGAASAQSVSFDFSSLGSALISFQGVNGDFDFSPDVSGFDFQITNASLPVMGLNGLKGNIIGTFTVGTITVIGGIEEAPVTGSGMLTINDGLNLFSSTIASSGYDALTVGSIGGLNTESVVNLSNFTYNGSNSSLQQLAGSGSAIETVSFQFQPAETLNQLAFGPLSGSTSFSGSLLAIPEPS